MHDIPALTMMIDVYKGRGGGEDDLRKEEEGRS
jgi:hypothetical protein